MIYSYGQGNPAFAQQAALGMTGALFHIINREVLGSIGVIGTAVAQRQPMNVAGLDFVRTFEHEVFEVMRQAGVVQVFIRRSHFVRNHGRDDGRARHRFEVNAQAVRQRFRADAVVKSRGRLESRVLPLRLPARLVARQARKRRRK